jgi:hypothetical protein
MSPRFRVGDKVGVNGSKIYRNGDQVGSPICWVVDRVYQYDEGPVWVYNLSHGEDSGGSGCSGITGATEEMMWLWNGKRDKPDWDEEDV